MDVKTGKQSVATPDVAELGGEWLALEHTAAIDLMNHTLGFDLFHRLYNVDATTTANGAHERSLIAVADRVSCPHPQCPNLNYFALVNNSLNE